jgi:ABC-type nitrate/sulfonate/bicarbonate transport system permease component
VIGRVDGIRGLALSEELDVSASSFSSLSLSLSHCSSTSHRSASSFFIAIAIAIAITITINTLAVCLDCVDPSTPAPRCLVHNKSVVHRTNVSCMAIGTLATTALALADH